MQGDGLLDCESRGCFDFFHREANLNTNSRGYGLVRDRAPGHKHVASIASVGFGLTALIIGVERGYISHTQGADRAVGTINTLLHNADHVHGFFYHFLDMNTAGRAWNSEVSIIDTAIALNGALTAGEYFGGRIREMAQHLYERVEWPWYRDAGRNLFYMGYTPERGFSGWWDVYAEQLMVYILGAGSPTHPVDGDMFYSFERLQRAQQGAGRGGFIHSWFGSLFTHQFTHAWVDFRHTRDQRDIDWWDNSVAAAQANRSFCREMAKHFKTFDSPAWGLTPCDSPWGYIGRFGAAPSARCDEEHLVDGTIPPAGAAGSIVFTPAESLETLAYYRKKHPMLWGRYGFQDAYNLDVSPTWYAPGVVGIDKGITLLMLENYRTGLVWEYFMKNTFVQQGLERIGLRDTRIQTDIA